MQTLPSPKGTRDFYPPDMAFREHMFSSWHATCRRYGFEQYDAPLFEHLDLYTRKSGEEIEKQLYAFQDKAGRWLALRPELTPSLARMVAARGTSLRKPIRWYSIPRVFRYEKMPRGRLREFFQLNMDILGVEEVTADAELIAASVAMMTDLGFAFDDFSVLVSSRKLLEEYCRFCGFETAKLPAVYALLDRRHKVGEDAFDADLRALTGTQSVYERLRAVLTARSLDELAQVSDSLESLHELRELFELLDMYGIGDCIVLDIGIVRGLAYYTGIVYELFDRKRTLRSIAGGGRYDRLVESYGGPPTPAVGFAAGDVVLAELLREKRGEPPCPPRSTVYVVCLGDSHPAGAIALTRLLRGSGIAAEHSLRRLSVARQLKLANASGAPFVAFVGGEEEQQGTVRLKDMRSGEESVVRRDAVVTELNGRFPQ
jgi:histidyl-tRNA synthetase